MKKTFLILFCAVAMFACQEKKSAENNTAKDTTQKVEKNAEKNSEKEKENTQESTKENAKESTNKPDYAKLILGRWVMPEQDGFEPWMFFDAEKSHSDGDEEGTEYQIDGNKLVYRVRGSVNPAEYKIIELTETKLVYAIDKDRKETWTKSNSKKSTSKKK